MLETMMVSSGSVMYVMAAVGILGVLAKIVNRMTLYRLIKAAGNMPKSTHKLMKLVKAKYEHACMAHESVENVGVFVEKYIYEYRGFLFRIHTWRQIELLSVWFVGILAVIGAALSYMEGGLTETVYQYIAGGAAEAVLLMVIIRMSDEPYKIKAIKMYMVDYLENAKGAATMQETEYEQWRAQAVREILDETGSSMVEKRLPINIEGEPQERKKAEKLSQNVGRGGGEHEPDSGHPQIREETIRQILEEFLA